MNDINVSGMQQVEDTIGEDDSSDLCRAPTRRVAPRADVIQRPRRNHSTRSTLKRCLTGVGLTGNRIVSV